MTGKPEAITNTQTPSIPDTVETNLIDRGHENFKSLIDNLALEDSFAAMTIDRFVIKHRSTAPFAET